jgi:hypothetical protein
MFIFGWFVSWLAYRWRVRFSGMWRRVVRYHLHLQGPKSESKISRRQTERQFSLFFDREDGRHTFIRNVGATSYKVQDFTTQTDDHTPQNFNYLFLVKQRYILSSIFVFRDFWKVIAPAWRGLYAFVLMEMWCTIIYNGLLPRKTTTSVSSAQQKVLQCYLQLRARVLSRTNYIRIR